MVGAHFLGDAVEPGVCHPILPKLCHDDLLGWPAERLVFRVRLGWVARGAILSIGSHLLAGLCRYYVGLVIKIGRFPG